MYSVEPNQLNTGEESTLTDRPIYLLSHKHSHAQFAHQPSSSSFFAIAFFLANSASARLPAKLGVGVLLRLLSEPFAPARLIPESRGCDGTGFRPAAGLFAGG